jgi:cellulose synthase/poly-beta-1,6-N-acetylglucosamine synthase-like glycosyltransferase
MNNSTIAFPAKTKTSALGVSLPTIKGIRTGFLFMLFLLLITGLLLYKVVLIVNTSLSGSFWTIYGLIATTFLISRIPYAYLHQDNHSKVYEASDYPNVSIIIAVKNEEAGIFRTIGTCIGSEYEGEVECIVIDDGSTDGTKKEALRAVEAYGERVRLIVFPENRGK